MNDISNRNLDVIVSGVSELEGRSMENLHAVAHREERIENTEKSIIQTHGTQWI